MTVAVVPVQWGTLGVDTMKLYLDGNVPKGPITIEHVVIDKTKVK